MIIVNIILALLSGLTIVLIIGNQLRLLHTGRVRVAEVEASYTALLQLKVDRFYFWFSRLFYELWHWLYYYCLLALRQALAFVRYLVWRAEKHFTKIIDTANGKRTIMSSGSASIFLKQIKDSQKTITPP